MSETPKVVSLRGNEIVPPGTPRPKVIALLEDLLERARSGELMVLSAVWQSSDESYSFHHEGRGGYGLVGALETLKTKIVDDLKDT